MSRRIPAAIAIVLWLASPPARAQDDSVRVLDDTFDPSSVRVAVGATVTWTNQGTNLHTVTADDGTFDSGDLSDGDTFSVTLDEPGVVPYFCVYHGAAGGLGMSGEIVVGEGAPRGPSGGPPSLPPPGAGRTILVPKDHGTVQAAVDVAEPGDLVLVSPGIYREAVLVSTPFLTIRGTDRNEVILDGEFRRPNGIHAVADGITVENMTARHYELNGFYWIGVDGYRASYLTAYNNGDYGIYAFDSVNGQLDHSYASGHPDSGFYIGQCRPCHAVITDVLAERNALGYSGTNAGGDLVITNSEWRLNMSGIVPNTLDSELLPPQRGATIVGNWVHDNNNPDAPALSAAYPSFGIGILLTGGLDNVVERNLVEDHETYGIAVTPNVDENLWIPGGNHVRDNVVRGSGLADLALGAPASGGNCFAGNDFSSSVPPAIQTLYGCGFGPLGGAGGDPAASLPLLSRYVQAASGDFPAGDWRTQDQPPPQANMPGAATAPPAPATEVPEAIDPGDAVLPEGDGSPRDVTREVTVFGIALATPTWWSSLLSVYGYLLPFALYAVWLSVAFWDLVRREDLASRARIGWMAVVLIVPLLGPILYYVFGRSPIPRSLRLMMVAGGLSAYVLFAGITVALAGT